jgi:8-oxo-dGTP pyrophosphatase MutT (NUDIX family)
MAETPRAPRGRRRGRNARRARVETSSGGVVFRRGGEALDFLLIRDPYNNWGLPKGHIEGGETPAEAAVREVAEETGLLDLAVVTQLPTIDWFFRDRGRLVHKFCHFFLVESASGDPQPQLTEGITACVWHSADLAIDTVSYSNARDVMRAAARWLTGADELPAASLVEDMLRNPVR